MADIDVKKLFRDNFLLKVASFIAIDDYVEKHIDKTCDDIFRVTLKHSVEKSDETELVGFDNLNTMYTTTEETEMISLPYEQYFGEMEISKEQKEDRIALADAIEESVYFLFALLAITDTVTAVDRAYFLSEDRAKLIAENESNSLYNYSEFDDAKGQGFTMKTWYTEADNKVRETHIPMYGVTIPIDEYFEVGDSLMLFPKDTSMGASADEIDNCRCTIEYS